MTTRETIDLVPRVVSAFGAANAAIPTPAQIARLRSLCEQFDAPARRGQPPASGADWVLAAIGEAVESGSHFVAPRRIARICERWAAEGGPGGAARSIAVEPPTRPRRAVGARAEVASPMVDAWEPADRVAEMAIPEIETEPPSAPAFIVFPDLGLRSLPFWQTVCDEARRRLGGSSDVSLLAGSLLLAREGNALTIGVPGRSVAVRAELRLKRTLEDVSRSIVGRSVELHFIGYNEWNQTDR